jgi:hypothetical protein
VAKDLTLIDSLKPFEANETASKKNEKPDEGEESVVLLTGATGFFGAFLLHEIHTHVTRAKVEATTTGGGQKKVSILCLVRAKSEAEGRDRVMQNLSKLGLPSTEKMTTKAKSSHHHGHTHHVHGHHSSTTPSSNSSNNSSNSSSATSSSSSSSVSTSAVSSSASSQSNVSTSPPTAHNDADATEGFTDDEDIVFGDAGKKLDLEDLANGYPDDKAKK